MGVADRGDALEDAHLAGVPVVAAHAAFRIEEFRERGGAPVLDDAVRTVEDPDRTGDPLAERLEPQVELGRQHEQPRARRRKRSRHSRHSLRVRRLLAKTMTPLFMCVPKGRDSCRPKS